MKKLIAAACLLAVSSTALLAQNAAAISQRQQLMKGFGAASRDPGQMLAGRVPFDADKVQASLKVYADGTKAAPALFPEDSKTGADTKALPIIWQEKDKFEAIFAAMNKDATAAMSSIKDEATFKTEMPKVLGHCNECHNTYRARS